MLIFGSKTWVMLAAMVNKLEGVHMGFLRQVTRMKEQRLGDETWKNMGPDRVLQAAGTKPLQEYINKNQATVAEWVSLLLIFEVCAKYTGYEGGGGETHELWWFQKAAEQQMGATSKNISEAAGERQ